MEERGVPSPDGDGFLEKLKQPLCLGIIRYCLGEKEVEDLGVRRDEGPAFAGWGRTQWRRLGSEGRPQWEVLSGGEGRGSKALTCRGVSESL